MHWKDFTIQEITAAANYLIHAEELIVGLPTERELHQWVGIGRRGLRFDPTAACN